MMGLGSVDAREALQKRLWKAKQQSIQLERDFNAFLLEQGAGGTDCFESGQKIHPILLKAAWAQYITENSEWVSDSFSPETDTFQGVIQSVYDRANTLIAAYNAAYATAQRYLQAHHYFSSWKDTLEGQQLAALMASAHVSLEAGRETEALTDERCAVLAEQFCSLTQEEGTWVPSEEVMNTSPAYSLMLHLPKRVLRMQCRERVGEVSPSEIMDAFFNALVRQDKDISTWKTDLNLHRSVLQFLGREADSLGEEASDAPFTWNVQTTSIWIAYQIWKTPLRLGIQASSREEMDKGIPCSIKDIFGEEEDPIEQKCVYVALSAFEDPEAVEIPKVLEALERYNEEEQCPESLKPFIGKYVGVRIAYTTNLLILLMGRQVSWSFVPRLKESFPKPEADTAEKEEFLNRCRAQVEGSIQRCRAQEEMLSHMKALADAYIYLMSNERVSDWAQIADETGIFREAIILGSESLQRVPEPDEQAEEDRLLQEVVRVAKEAAEQNSNRGEPRMGADVTEKAAGLTAAQKRERLWPLLKIAKQHYAQGLVFLPGDDAETKPLQALRESYGLDDAFDFDCPLQDVCNEISDSEKQAVFAGDLSAQKYLLARRLEHLLVGHGVSAATAESCWDAFLAAFRDEKLNGQLISATFETHQHQNSALWLANGALTLTFALPLVVNTVWNMAWDAVQSSLLAKQKAFDDKRIDRLNDIPEQAARGLLVLLWLATVPAHLVAKTVRMAAGLVTTPPSLDNFGWATKFYDQKSFGKSTIVAPVEEIQRASKGMAPATA